MNTIDVTIDVKSLEDWYSYDQPNRRVDKHELKEWFKRVGEAELIDDLDDDARIDHLWGTKRLRNVKMIAAVTAADLCAAGYVEAEAKVVEPYLRKAPRPAAAAPPEQNITVVMQPDPDADRRSTQQSEHLSKSIAEAVAGKDKMDRFIDGEARRPTVKEALALLEDAREHAAKLADGLCSSLEMIAIDPYAHVTGNLLGLNVQDKRLFKLVRSAMTQSQYSRFGGAVVDSGVLLARQVLMYSVEMDMTLFNAKCEEAKKVGKTILEGGILKRVELLEKRLLNVRYSRRFDLAAAVDWLSDAVNPKPSIMMKCHAQWQAGAKDQAALTDLFVLAREEAEKLATGSTSTQPTPNSRDQVRTLLAAGPRTQSASFKSASKSPQFSNASSRDRSSNERRSGLCWDLQNTGKCDYPNCKFSHDLSGGQTRVNWRDRAPVKSVNSVSVEYVQELESRLTASDERNTQILEHLMEMRQQNESLVCNMTWLQEKYGVDELLGDSSEHTTPFSVYGMSVQKMLKRPRALSEMQRARQVLKNSSSPQVAVATPIIDSATDTSVVASIDSKYCTNTRAVQPIAVSTVTGSGVSDTVVTMRTAVTDVDARPLKGAKRSLCAVTDLNAAGYTYVQTPKDGAGLVKGDSVIECPPEGNMYRLPAVATPGDVGSSRAPPPGDVGSSQAPPPEAGARSTEMQLAEKKFRKFVQRRKLMQMLEHARTHTPADLLDCDDCKDAAITKQPSTRKKPNRYREAEFDGLVLSFDFMVGLPRDNDGNTCAFNVDEATHDLGYLIPTKTRDSKMTLENFKIAIQQIFAMLPEAKRKIKSVHSDMEKSFVGGDLAKYILDNHWNQTETEGYDCNAAARIENRNKRLKRIWRSFLLHATGGRMYYQQCWGNFARTANDVMLHTPVAGTLTPMQRAGSASRDWRKDGHVPGAKCTYWLAPARRDSNDDVPGRRGVWGGYSDKVPGGHRIIPVKWSVATQRWLFEPTVHVKRAIVEDDVMLLRQIQPASADGGRGSTAVEFDAFVDKFSGSGTTDDVYEISKIVGHRTVKGVEGEDSIEYRVRWKGYGEDEDTFEPEEHLVEYGAGSAMKAYKRKSGLLVNHISNEDFTPTLRAVVQLMEQHKLEGNVSEWMAAYDAEYSCVYKQRLRELNLGSSEYEWVKRHEKVIKLRMNPEPKKDGRKKMRLLVRGDTEPAEWNEGKCLDSPTVMASTVKMMIALQDDGDEHEELSIGDISTAFLTSPNYAEGSRKRYVGHREFKGGPLRIFELKGSLYGQRDAPQRFYDSLREALLGIGFEVSKNDICLYKHKRGVTIATHVDDVLCRATRDNTEWFWGELKKLYTLKAWDYVTEEQPRLYCGLRIGHHVEDGVRVYTIDQIADVAAFLVDQVGLGLRPVKAPMPDKHQMQSDNEPATKAMQTWFRSALMSISWFACQTRFDVSHTVSQLAQKMVEPTVGAVMSLKRLIAYMMHKPEFTLVVRRVKQENDWKLYVDSDHAGDKPHNTRSHTGLIFFLNGMPIHWRSKKQPVTALSSAAAEVYAFSEAVKEANLLMWRAEDIGVKVNWPINIYEDNKATVSFQHSTTPSSKLRGIYNLRWAWVLELRDTSKVRAVKIATDMNIADILTKCYKPHELNRMLKICGIA